MATGVSSYMDVVSGSFTLRVQYSEEYDITSNSSTVTITSVSLKSSSYGGYGYYPHGYIKVNGVEVANYSSTLGTHNVYLSSKNTFYEIEAASGYSNPPYKSGSIVHNDDGSKNVNIEVYINLWRTSSGAGSGTNLSGSHTAVLTTIPRKSTLAASNGTLGTAQTLTVTRKSTSFTHTITYTSGEYSGTICTKSSSTSISWTPPLTLATGAPNGTSVFVSFTITTYNGNTAIGSNTGSINCAIPTSVVPTVSISVSDANGYSSTYGGYVQSKSKIKVTISASGKYYSSIKSYKTTVDGKTYTSSSFTTDAIKGSGTLSISCTVTDSRGRTATTSKTVTVLAYSAPKITALNVYRSNSDGGINATGSYLAVDFSASITSLNNTNSATYTVGYKKSTESSYNTVAVTSQAGKYSVSNAIYTFPADTSSTYDVILTAMDDFSSPSMKTTGASIFKLLSIHKDGKGLAVGKVVELDNKLDVGLDAKFRKNVDIDGNLNTTGTITGSDVVTNAGRALSTAIQGSSATFDTIDDYISYVSSKPLLTSMGRWKLNSSFSPKGQTNWYRGFAALQNRYGETSHDVNGTVVCAYGQGELYYGELYSLGGANSSATWYRVPVISAQGTSGIWTYRKWSNGIAECWGKTSAATVNMTSTWGSLYVYDNAIAAVALPFTFTAIPVTVAFPIKNNANYWMYTCYQGTTTSTPSYGVARGNTSSNIQVSAELYVIGKWK